MPILVVDDNDLVRDVLRVLLELLGFEPLTARSSAEALELFRRRRPRAVIMDNRMPGETTHPGVALAARVKRESPATPAIMLAAAPPREAHLVCDVVLTKPVTMAQLRDVLCEVGVTAVTNRPAALAGV